MKNVILKAGINESGKPVLTDKVGNQYECPVNEKANKQKLTWAVKKEAFVKVIMKEGGAMSYSVSNSSTEKDWTKDATSVLNGQWLVVKAIYILLKCWTKALVATALHLKNVSISNQLKKIG